MPAVTGVPRSRAQRAVAATPFALRAQGSTPTARWGIPWVSPLTEKRPWRVPSPSPRPHQPVASTRTLLRGPVELGQEALVYERYVRLRLRPVARPVVRHLREAPRTGT